MPPSSQSEASNTLRTSISSPSSNGIFLTQSITSSFDLTSTIQNPAISSLASVKGPSVTVNCPFWNFTRAPLPLSMRPSPETSTPALISCSLNLPMASMTSLLGITPASLSWLALTMIM
jgi:hypothetical protein